MSIGRCRIRFALAYVDEVLADFSLQPQKSTQFVFQRLLIVCGGESESVAFHAATVLLSSVGLLHLSTYPTKQIDEGTASHLFGLIFKFATEEQPGRSAVEVKGAEALFRTIVERVCGRIQTVADQGGKNILLPLIEILFNKVFIHVDPVQQCVFLVSVFAGEVSLVVSGLVEQLLHQLFVRYLQKNNKCTLRVEYVIRCLECYLRGTFPDTCPLTVVKFIKQVENDSNHFLLQPFIFRLLARKGGVSSELSEEKLRDQTTELLQKRVFDTTQLREAIMDTNIPILVAMMLDAGPTCTVSIETFRNACEEAGLTNVPIQRYGKASDVAAVIMMMTSGKISIRYAEQMYKNLKQNNDKAVVGLPEWNGKVFAEFWNSQNRGQIDMADVLPYLDNEQFRISRRNELIILTDILLTGTQAKDLAGGSAAAFPIAALYNKWNHIDGQLSWLTRIIENPDVFCLRDYPHRPVHLASLKNAPDENDKSILNWMCVDLTETLLSLVSSTSSEKSHIANTHVLRLFQGAMTTCPDILLLALFQIPPPITLLRQHIFQVLIPNFILQHSNAVSVLNYAWNSEILPRVQVHGLILNAVISLHLKAPEDQQRLARLLDIVHELKPSGLSELFVAAPIQFVVDLACLASKRDYLKLDKFLEDKFNENGTAHGSPLIRAVVSYMERRPTNITTTAAGNGTETIIRNFLRNHMPTSSSLRPRVVAIIESGPPQQPPSVVPLPQPHQQQVLLPASGIQQIMKESSGRSSSVSSTGRAAAGGSHHPFHANNFPPTDGQQQQQIPAAGPGGGFPGGPLPPNYPRGFVGAAAPPRPPAAFSPAAAVPGGGGAAGNSNPFNVQPQQHQPGSGAPNATPAGLGAMFAGGSYFGDSRELLKNVPPAPAQFSGNGMALSPSSQMMRSAMPQAPQRQNSSSGGWQLPTAPGVRPPGPPTPSSHMDFRPQMPPTDFVSNRTPAPSVSSQSSDIHESFAEDIQEEANSYFEQIYSPTGNMTVNDLINRLKGFKVSSHVRDQKILACVVKNLFEEYRFFHEYPERELKTTAEVYGGIIREGIISNLHFATAVRKVIESIQSDYGGMLWTFGIVSLNACRVKLSAYPKVCAMIAKSDNFNRFPPQLKEYVTAGMKGELPVNLPVEPPSTTGSGRSTPPVWAPAGIQRNNSGDNGKTGALPKTGNVLSYTNVETLVAATEKEGAEVAQPAEAVVDKISFLFNNLSHTNLGPKKAEVLSLIDENGEPFVRWLAQYIVMKRVSIEQNFQPLYNSFVQSVDHPLLDLHIKKETFRNIRILLRSDKRQAASNYSDRQLLKNLGMWLGSITIARSKPILISELDLKSLLLEAYYKGQQELLFVVPFIAKILFSCSKLNTTPGTLHIFGPTCAWIRSILKILAELHNEPDLKINLKFEIEVLCKELTVDLQQLPIEGVLKDTDKLVRVPQQLSDLKILARPENLPASSPVPSSVRLTTDATGLAPTESKPATPAPDAENATAANGPEVSSGGNTPHFAYHDINVLSFDGLVPHIKIQSTLPLFQLHPQLKHCVRTAFSCSIRELIVPASDRALKIAMTVTENLIRKDFALDPDENKMKIAAIQMMRAMTAGMAMITCREPLAQTMVGFLINHFTASLRTTIKTAEQTKMIEEAALQVTQDNIELTTNFVVKTACEKATSEMDKHLEQECQRRVEARRLGEAWHDAAAEQQQALLPPKIATPNAPTKKENMAVYELFSSRICGFKPSVAEDGTPEAAKSLPAPPETVKEIEALTAQVTHILREVEITMHTQPFPANKAFQGVGAIRDLLSQLAADPRDAMAIVNLIGRSVEHLLHAFHVDPNSKNPLDVEWPRRLRDLFIGVCRVLLTQYSQSELSRRITSAIVSSSGAYKWNVEAMEVLLKHNLLQTSVLDGHLAIAMDSGSNIEATIFAQRFMRVIGGQGHEANKITVIKETFPNTYAELLKVQQMQQATRAAAPGETAGGVDSPVAVDPFSLGQSAQQRQEDTEMSNKVELILREWIGLCYTPMAQRSPQEALGTMIHMMHEHGVLAADDKISQFFRLCTEMCVDVSLRLLKSDSSTSFHQSTIVRQRCYYTLDAFVKLMALMIKHSDGSQCQTKVNLLKKLLTIITNVLILDHEVRRADFNSMPYHRILISLFNELTTPDGTTLLEPIAWQILEAFGQAMFMLQPRRVPGFAFAWLDIAGHRNVIGRLLGEDTVEPVKTAAMYTQLIICHLKFLAPYLRNIQLPKSIAVLYKGTLRVLLVILHDFPELLCEYHYVICDTIPPNCVQLRNLVLSAYPRNMRLPDPFALNFKQVDTIAEMSIEPKSNLNMATIIPEAIKNQLDDYLLNRQSVDFLSTLPALLQVSQVPGSKYNTTVMNAVVLYVGKKAIEALHQRRQRISISTIAHTAFMDIFQNLAVQLCTEGRYLLFNAIANQLRYPNAHTHYFSCVFLFLFLNSDHDAIQEQITRILFERLVALRPHPWGLLITFIELIKNPGYNFWKYEFTRCAPEIERLFQNVANTCVAPRPPVAEAARA